MKNKRDLAKVALAALVLASAAPLSVQADVQANGIFLATGCAAHGCPSPKNSKADAPATLTEAQLLGTLDSKGRAMYLGLTPEGKALAIQLASQSSNQDKAVSVQEAQRRMNERRDSSSR